MTFGLARPAWLAALAALLMLAGCERIDASLNERLRVLSGAAQPAQQRPVRDHAAESLGLPDPVVDPLDTWFEAALPSPGAKARVGLRRAFFAGEFDAVETTLSTTHAAYVNGETPLDLTSQLIGPLFDLHLAGAQRCEQWLQQRPRSYMAHYVCGRLWQAGAWQARTQDAAAQVSNVRFALMRSRLQRSNTLLERAVTLEAKPIQALTVLADNQYLLSQREQGKATLERAFKLMPAHGPAHEVAARFAMPVWGGTDEALAAAFARAKAAGVHGSWLTHIEDHLIARPWRSSTPGAEKDYWEKALAEKTTADRLHDFAMYHVRLQAWRPALPLLERALAEKPDSATDYYWRGRTQEELGQLPAALADFRLAAALGHEEAIGHLIYAHINGSLGLPPRDLAALLRLCRHAAGLGSPHGANCLASGLWDASMPGLARNPAQALAWHLLASRGGHWNSQYDLGWLLMSRKLDAVEAPDAREVGIFWLQRAAEQGHTFAERKLQEAGVVLDSRDRPARR